MRPWQEGPALLIWLVVTVLAFVWLFWPEVG